MDSETGFGQLKSGPEYSEPDQGVPDWQAIHNAHRQAEAMGLVSPNSRRVGSVSISEAFEQAGEPVWLPWLDPEPLPQKSTGFGSRSKTRRTAPYRAPTDRSEHRPLREKFKRLLQLRADIECEIDHPDRQFFRVVEEMDPDGDRYPTKKYIYDEEKIADIRRHEHEVLELIVQALRVSIFEAHPRTRGFPGTRRLQGANGEYRNAGYLRSRASGYLGDRLVQAMLTDAENRFLHPQPVDTPYRYWRTTPDWEKSYDPDEDGIF